MSVLRLHAAEGDLLVEPPPSAAPGIQPQDAVFLPLLVFVGMAEHHHIHAGQVLGHVLFVMDEEEPDALHRKGQAVGQVLRPILIVVAPDDIALPRCPECIHNSRRVDVPGVDDHVRLSQQGFDLLPKQAVGIG